MSSWTVGKKLTATFSLMVLVCLALLWSYMQQTYASNRAMQLVLYSLNKKLEIGREIELATTDMQGAQRGLMLSYEADDPESAPQYVELYDKSGKTIDLLLQQMEALAATPAEKSALTSIRSSRITWAPRFKVLVDLCATGKIKDAYSLRSQNKLISAAMHTAASTLVSEQQVPLERAASDSKAAFLRAEWMGAGAALMCVLAALLLYGVVSRITRALRQSLEELQEGASQLQQGAGEISNQSKVLAVGTAEQAAAIGETSSASEKVSSMTERNAQSASRASGLMVEATALVEDANKYLEQMQMSMNEMTDSSRRVGKINQIIEQIAFQTNILALNAAVEAARAGEAGMGFAVVADEVRSLAQRSSEAAKDTVTLIEESMAKSREGRAKLDLMADSIKAITQSSSKVKDLVDEVRSSSDEQSRGIHIISSTMGNIRRVTQSAAESAEQGAATSEQIQSQAESLARIAQSLRTMVG